MTTAVAPRPALEVADILRQYGETFRARYGGLLSDEQRQAVRDLTRCRTSALGGHVERCLDCGHERIAYNSCRNRHCPKCQALTRARWLEEQSQHLLPVEYHHVVFTLPQEVAALALANPRLLYGVLFEASSAALREVAANPKWLGAQVGVLMVLHTWGQNLHHHPHVHCVCTGGGLSCNATGDIDLSPTWRRCPPGFFLPVRVLSRVYRDRYLGLLQKAYHTGQLFFPLPLATLNAPPAFAAWLGALQSRDWVVYSKPPFGGPAQVLKYLARYTHRVAISNSRLLKLEDGRVAFRYKDYADDHRQKTLTLSAHEFLRRFLQHVLPKSFVKIRHYGLLANRRRDELLPLCRRLLLVEAARPAASEDNEVSIEPAAGHRCPHCGSERILCLPLPEESQKTQAAPIADSS
jgi:predicted Zn-ribbon and HTH transcriptional regulator